MNRRVHLLISGRVQGVCFRMYTQNEAQQLGVAGWVRNRDDGRVEVVAEGDEPALAGFVDWCRHGPPYAQVTRFEESYSQPIGEFDGFRVRY
ncbi:MAG: acylphosphatase [Kiritimatiellae bacterium]|nr:acylphosphatase [Kiritimatiellia bacterium]